jgi:tRNA pseudouridine13 synthase
MLARWLTEHARPEQLRQVRLRLGWVPFPAGLDAAVLEEFAALSLPLPSARWKPEPADSRLGLVEAVLAEEGLTLGEMRVRGVRELFFSRGERSACCRPSGLTAEWGDDERNRGKRSLTLRFELPRGSYATLIVKAVCP